MEDTEWELFNLNGQTVFPVYAETGELVTDGGVSYILRLVNGKVETIGFKVPRP